MSETKHPIQIVSRRTGLSADVIRAWERRYKAVKPSRSANGRRLYSDNDVKKLMLLQRIISGGRRIGDIAKLNIKNLESLIESDESATVVKTSLANRPSTGSVMEHFDGCTEAIGELDANKLISLFEIASIDLKNYLCCSSHKLFLNNPDKKLISTNLPVMAKESYVGQTRKNHMNFIEVILFSDAEHLLPIKSSSFFCNARGRGKPLMISCVVNTEESALTNVNDSIFTSGLGGVFMPNIKVGEIIEINSLSIDESEVIIKLIDDPLEQTLFGIVG